MRTPSIKPVKRAERGHNRFCGPAALSIIAGVDTAEAASVIRHVSGKRNVTGTSHGQLLRALALLGCRAVSAAKVDPLHPKNNPTLAAWLRSGERDGQSLYLVAAGGHWQVVQGRRYCCGLTGCVVSIRDDRVKRRARIVGVWRIEVERRVALSEVLPAKPKRNVQLDATRRKVHRIANLFGIEVETERCGGYTSIIVWGPHWASNACEIEADPFEGDHYADNWADALKRVQTYADLKNRRPELFA